MIIKATVSIFVKELDEYVEATGSFVEPEPTTSLEPKEGGYFEDFESFFIGNKEVTDILNSLYIKNEDLIGCHYECLADVVWNLAEEEALSLYKQGELSGN